MRSSGSGSAPRECGRRAHSWGSPASPCPSGWSSWKPRPRLRDDWELRVLAARIQLHGRFAVQVGGRSVEHGLPGRRARLLVAYLAAHRLSAVDRARLIELLWAPSDP